MTVERVSLVDFAKNAGYRTGPAAWITTIPEFDAIVDAWNSGAVSLYVIREWLIAECGYSPDEATQPRIKWIATHHRRPKHG